MKKTNNDFSDLKKIYNIYLKRIITNLLNQFLNSIFFENNKNIGKNIINKRKKIIYFNIKL